LPAPGIRTAPTPISCTRPESRHPDRLLGYPFIRAEFGLKELSRLWTVGYICYGSTILTYVLAHRQTDVAAVPAVATARTARRRVDLGCGWAGSASTGAGGLAPAFTTHVTAISRGAAAVVLPLSLYLLTFVLVFRDRPLIHRRSLLYLHLAAVAVALLALSQTKHETWFLTAATGVAVFFTSAMVAHRTLYEARPAARYLTEFYLWMSFGGALGGLSAALIAPKIFSEVFEYPLLLALSMACRPGVFSTEALRRLWASIAAVVARFTSLRLPARAPEMTERDKQEALVLWLIIAGGILAIYWLPWAVSSSVNVGEWGSTPMWSPSWCWCCSWKSARPQFAAAILIFCALVCSPPASSAAGAAELLRRLSRGCRTM
jgi:hypothetical protein